MLTLTLSLDRNLFLLQITNYRLNVQDTRVTLPPGAEDATDNQGCFFYLAGVNDYESDPQYGPALNGRDESVATVLLAHEPVQVRLGQAISSFWSGKLERETVIDI